jgi:uncharacterized protein YhdP
MSERNLLRRHPLIILVSLGTVAVALWVSYYLATFDLNDYRTQLATELSQRLQMPVQLGEARLELREGGIAFHFSRLQIGTVETSTELHAEDLWLQLAWHGLLQRKPIFTEVALDQPQLRISPLPQPPPAESAEESSSDLELLRDLQIRRVEINHGTLDLNWLDQAGQPRTFPLHDLNVNLGDLGLARTVTFDLGGKLPGHGDGARLALSGRVDLPEHGSWRKAAWDVTLEAKGLAAARLAELLPDQARFTAAGAADLQLFVKGRFDEDVTVQAEVSGQGLRVRPGTAYRQAVPLKHLQITGTWQHQDNVHTVRQVVVQLDDLRLAGEFSVTSGPQGVDVKGQLGTATLPLDTVRRWLPTELRDSQPLLARMQPGGTVLLEHAVLRAALPATPKDAASFVLEALNGEAQQLAWSIGREQSADLTSLSVRLADGRWHLSGGSGMIASVPVVFSGTIDTPAAASPQFAFELASSVPAEQLSALWPKALPAELALTGALQLSGRLQGTPELVTLEASLDLAQLEARYGEHLHLPPTAGALLTVQGEGTRNALSIAQTSLSLPPFKGQLTGAIDWTEAVTLEITGSLELADLEAAYPLVPALDKLQLRGGATLDLALNGTAEALQPRLSLNLREVGIRTHGVIGDISQLHGRLLLDGKSLRSERLTARIGNSPVTLMARVADLTAPQLDLDVKSPAIRADDLIFRSQEAMLRDLSGQLLIDREGIAFRPVNVRLDGGTRATIIGSVKNFSAPKVDLDITGDYANVAEIIRLWTDESPTAKAERQARVHAGAAHVPDIRIKVKAREGELFGMKFSSASALITPSAGHLLLHPLDFNVGAGYCTTQVLVDYAEAATVLRVSGHLENVDAYAVFNELLQRKSILRGTLRGDFFLEGEIGGRGFLPTSYGNISATVRDGVLRQAPLFSTIFSLLNVSQLFELKLPDINLEGLPFTLLTTEVALDKGVLSTEKLVIDSPAINMSSAGQYDMVNNEFDLLVVAKPLGTIDKVVTRLPIAGWILGGEDKALITAQFKVTGPGEKPKVEAIPITAISKGVLGIFQRTLGLPLRLIEDPAILWGGGGEKKN